MSGEEGVGVIDTHVHIWDLASTGLSAWWLEAGWEHPLLGDISPVQVDAYRLDDLQADSAGSPPEGIVHVGATDATGDPVAETVWVQQVADVAGANLVIISAGELAAADAAATLRAHARNPRFRGIRDVTAARWLMDRSWQDGCRHLAELGGICELVVPAAVSAAVVDAAEALPDVTFVVEHAAFPPPPVADGYSEWVQHLRHMATADNVVCKISGLAMCDPHWREHGIDQTVHHCLDTFGPTRCLVGTNWPVDSVVAGYTELAHAYQTALAHLPNEHQAAVLNANAQRLYRL